VLRRILLLLVFAITVVPAGEPQDDQGSETAVIRPLEIEEALVNPGMGITTFQRFNGDPINAGLEWSEEGPTSKLQPAPAPPDFPDTSIAYCRWFWSGKSGGAGAG